MLTRLPRVNVVFIVSAIAISAEIVIAETTQKYKPAAKPPTTIIFTVAVPTLRESSLRVSAITSMWVPPLSIFQYFNVFFA